MLGLLFLLLYFRVTLWCATIQMGETTGSIIWLLMLKGKPTRKITELVVSSSVIKH